MLEKKRNKLLEYCITFQGFYYAVFGIWGLLHIDSFSTFTKYQGDFFLKHTNAVLFTVLGCYLFHRGITKRVGVSQVMIGSIAGLGIGLVDSYYLSVISAPFIIDMLINYLFFLGYLIIMLLHGTF